MADLSPTPANVLKGASSRTSTGIAGEAIVAGDVVRMSSNQYVKAAHDTTTNAEVAGIALNNASTGQPLTILTEGPINLGVTLEVGTVYALSGTAGAIAPLDDVTNEDFVTLLGTATDTDVLQVRIDATGAQIPAA